MSSQVWLVPVLLAVGCNAAPHRQEPEPAGQLRASLGVVTSAQGAGLVTLSAAAGSARLASKATVRVDLALANGGLELMPNAVATGNFQARGDARLQPQSSIVGDVVLGGSLSTAPGAGVSGTITQGASVPLLTLPSAEALAGNEGSFGELAADIVVAPATSATLGTVTERVSRLELGPKAELLVTGKARLEVTGSLEIGAQARVVVKSGGSLTVLLRGQGELAAKATVLQEQDKPGGLRLFVATSGDLRFEAGSHFGPGLVYFPARSTGGTALLKPDRLEGALVCGALETAPQASLNLSSRYLRCTFDRTAPTLSLTSPGGSTTVPASQTTIEVSGLVKDDGGVERLELTDASGTRALTTDNSGAFTASAALRPDGEPTEICLRAVDCAERQTQSCISVEKEAALDLQVQYPSYGVRLDAASVDVRGSVSRGELLSVVANGKNGTLSGRSFSIAGVALSEGWNVIEVRGSGPSGATKTVRVAVARGTLPVRRATVTLFGDARAELKSVGGVLGTNRDELPVLGFVHYRLLDASGTRLFVGTVPGTSEHTYHPDGSSYSVPPTQFAQLIPSERAFLIPALSGATAIEFTDAFGDFLGQGSLP